MDVIGTLSTSSSSDSLKNQEADSLPNGDSNLLGNSYDENSYLSTSPQTNLTLTHLPSKSRKELEFRSLFSLSEDDLLDGNVFVHLFEESVLIFIFRLLLCISKQIIIASWANVYFEQEHLLLFKYSWT